MKIQILDQDGSIEGWFVALLITVNIFILLNLSFFFLKFREVFKEIGGTITTIYIGQFSAWLAYRGATKILGKE